MCKPTTAFLSRRPSPDVQVDRLHSTKLSGAEPRRLRRRGNIAGERRNRPPADVAATALLVCADGPHCPAKGWPAGATPMAAAGLAVNAHATGLDHPRWIYVLPNGDVLVAESNGPSRPDDGGGIKGWVSKLIMQRAGGAVPSANRITLLRDTDGDGIADTRAVFLTGLNSPFGMALVGNDLYVANTDSIMRFPYKAGDTQITAPGARVTDLPAGTINHP